MKKFSLKGIALNHSHLCSAVQKLMVLLEILIQCAMLIWVWEHFYNASMPVPIYRRGYYPMALFYGALLYICLKALRGRDIGDMRVFEIIVSQSIALLLCNVAAYLPLCLISYRIIAPTFLLLMTMVQLGIIVVWCFLCNRLFFYLFRPMEMLLICDDPGRTALLEKLKMLYWERYHICAVLPSTAERSELRAALPECHAVLLDTEDRELKDWISIQCFRKNLFLFMVPTMEDVILHSARRLHITDTPLLTTGSHRVTASDALVKRCLDIAVSALGLLVASPVILLSALAVKLEDGGSAFFRQERLTLDGKRFWLVKLRTMRMDAEKNGQKLAEKNDPRITRVGAVLRKCRLDELPQLWNVLRGEMSLVGPRPECPALAEEYEKTLPEFGYRLKVKAGITGMAQVYGNYATTPRDKLLMDIMYIEDYTLSLDVKLLFLTVRTLFLTEKTDGVEKETKGGADA